jgi:photosystem II stability/assembly factor-like uncharacterized protein
VGGRDVFGGTVEPLILHTSDGGTNWQQQWVQGVTCFEDIFALDSEQLWAVGEYGAIYHTIDGGQLWTPQVSNTGIWLQKVSFVNAEYGWACGYTYTEPALLKTTDGGENWQVIPMLYYDYIGDVKFFDENNGWLLAGGSVNASEVGVLHTTDGGDSWQSVYGNAGNGLFFTDADNGWMCGVGGMIMHWNGSEAVPRNSEAAAPSTYSLSAYPNPFNPTTTVSFDLAKAGQARIAVYDILGRVVQVLGNQVYPQGSHRVLFNASALPSGMYFVRLDANAVSKTQKLLLLK